MDGVLLSLQDEWHYPTSRWALFDWMSTLNWRFSASNASKCCCFCCQYLQLLAGFLFLFFSLILGAGVGCWISCHKHSSATFCWGFSCPSIAFLFSTCLLLVLIGISDLDKELGANYQRPVYLWNLQTKFLRPKRWGVPMNFMWVLDIHQSVACYWKKKLVVLFGRLQPEEMVW